jgi:pimeloyl-ACP methyl ester carboxylesterase
MSDAVPADTPLEVRMDDVRAVMDAVASERAAVVGMSEGAPMCTLFAATYPDRTWALVLHGGEARLLWALDYPWGEHEAELRAAIDAAAASNINDPERMTQRARAASPNSTDEEIAAIVNYFRHGGSPGARVALARMNMSIDVRDVLPAIRVPTLVMHDVGDPWVPLEAGRYLAQHVPDARYVEFEGSTHLPAAADAGPYLDEIQRFLETAWESAADAREEPDRVLATVLFTDIAGSSERTGARVASPAEPGEVLVSSTVKDLVAGSGIRFEDRGVAELKGIPGEWRLFAVDRAS